MSSNAPVVPAAVLVPLLLHSLLILLRIKS
jgi:hypothetical protein